MMNGWAAAAAAMAGARALGSQPVYEYRANIVKVHDGDTFTADVDLGFSIYSRHSIRLAHLNAPELNTQAGKDSLAWVQTWLKNYAATGVVKIVTQPGEETEKYGRYLAVVYGLGGQCLNELMLAAGYAAPYPS